jgi:hypothetical protein
MSKKKLKTLLSYAICGLPLAGAAVANTLVVSAKAHQFLVLITLIWLQVFFLFEVFSIGK